MVRSTIVKGEMINKCPFLYINEENSDYSVYFRYISSIPAKIEGNTNACSAFLCCFILTGTGFNHD